MFITRPACLDELWMPRAVQSAVSDKGQSADELASVLLSTANHSASLNHVKAQKKGAADCRSLINALVTICAARHMCASRTNIAWTVRRMICRSGMRADAHYIASCRVYCARYRNANPRTRYAVRCTAQRQWNRAVRRTAQRQWNRAVRRTVKRRRFSAVRRFAQLRWLRVVR